MTQRVTAELRGLRDLPYGTARTAATETIARRVEAEGPPEALAEALLDLVEAYTFSGEGAKSFVTFARLLRLWDQSPELFDAADRRNLFWEFKWIAADLADFPQISPEQAEAFLADMQQRFEFAGNGLSSVRMSRFLWAWWTGRSDVEQSRLAWIGGERDEFEDCEACTIGNQTHYFVEIGDYESAVAIGVTQQSRCNKEPACTHHATALAALLSGDPELALAQHRLALATTTDENNQNASARTKCFEMLARGGRLETALAILRNDDAAQLRGAASPLQQLRFLLGIIAGLSANLPEHSDLETGLPDPEMGDVASLHAWATREAGLLAEKFDARNGNDYYALRLDRALAAPLAERPLPEESPAIPAFDASELAPEPVGLGHVGTVSAGASLDHEATAEQATGDTHFANAERALTRKQYLEAARHYAASAEAFVHEGWIERAGLAYAEAAQSAAEGSDDETAHRGFATAIPLLHTGGAEANVIVSVLTAWAPVAARLRREGEPMLLMAECLTRLEAVPDRPSGELSDELAARLRREQISTRATARDTLARLIASADPTLLPDQLDRDRSAREATTAGEEYAQLGRLADAAHAFWLAGKVQRELGRTSDALWSLESAFEGFTAARAKQQRADAASELIELLRQAGRLERADEIAAALID